MNVLRSRWQSTAVATLVLVSSFGGAAPAIAKTFEGKCYNQLEKDYDGCKIKTSKRDIHIRFKTKENRRADQIIPARQVTKISSGKRAKGRLKSLTRGVLRSRFSPLPLVGKIGLGLVPGLSTRKYQRYLIEYTDELGTERVALFRVKRKHAKKLSKELKKRTKVKVD